MSGRILEKYVARNGEHEADAESNAEDMGAFGWLHGIRDRAIMLELRRKSGDITAIGYGWIERIDFDPSEGITLHALGQKIKIKGQNLNLEMRPTVRLFEGLCRHRVPWLKEADRASALQNGSKSVVIEAIEA